MLVLLHLSARKVCGPIPGTVAEEGNSNQTIKKIPRKGHSLSTAAKITIAEQCKSPPGNLYDFILRQKRHHIHICSAACLGKKKRK